MTAEQRVKLVWPQAVREVRGGIVSPGIWEDSHPMADFLGETWAEVANFDRVVKAHERYIRELSVPLDSGDPYVSTSGQRYRNPWPPSQNPHNAPLPETLRQLSRPNLNIYGRRISTAIEEAMPQSALCNCDLLSNEHEVSEHELLLSWMAAQKACEGDYHQAYVEVERELLKYRNAFAKQSADLIMAKADIALLKDLLGRLANAKRLRDAKDIDDGDFLGFAEETADEYLEKVREAKR